MSVTTGEREIGRKGRGANNCGAKGTESGGVGLGDGRGAGGRRGSVAHRTARGGALLFPSPGASNKLIAKATVTAAAAASPRHLQHHHPLPIPRII